MHAHSVTQRILLDCAPSAEDRGRGETKALELHLQGQTLVCLPAGKSHWASTKYDAFDPLSLSNISYRLLKLMFGLTPEYGLQPGFPRKWESEAKPTG